MRVRYYNPEGEKEYLTPGDKLIFTTDIPIFAFSVPGRKTGDVKRLIEAQEGDLVQYVGTTFQLREFAVTKNVPLYEFIFMPTNDAGEVVSKIPFVIKNVETILKWTEKL
jgi:hypothetical protein